VFASRYPADQNLFYRGGNTTFPLYWYHQATSLGLDSGKRHNLSARFLAGLAGRLSLARIPTTGLPVGVDAEDVVHYVYSVLHSASYRSRYEEFTKVDFPRIPLPGGHDLFRLLTDLGGELVGLHLLESPRLDVFCTTYTGQKSPEVGRVGWVDDTVWLDAPAKTKGKPTAPGTIGFCGVPEAVWKFEIGGYQVCEKWLKDRKGRKLLKADIDHYQKTVVALAETIRIMKEIDEVIEAHGGWPGAFQGAATTPAVSELPFRKVAEPRKHPYEQGEPE
jgi:predicted helicase